MEITVNFFQGFMKLSNNSEKENKMKKTFMCIVMVVCMLFQATVPGYAFDVSDNEFELIIYCDDNAVDMSCIEIDIYTATLAYSEPENGYFEFDEEYAFSVSTNKNGVANFARPSNNFSFSVNLNTLPDEYGTTDQTAFIEPEKSSYSTTLMKIENVDVVYENDVATPVLTSKSGTPLYAATETRVSSLKNKAYSANADNQVITYKQPVQVVLDGQTYDIEKAVSYAYEDEIDKAGYLYDTGLMSEYEYILTLSKYVLGEISVQNSVEIDGTELYWKIRNYYEENSLEKNRDLTTIKKALDSFGPSANTVTRSETYVVSNSGHFRVDYDNTSISAAAAKAVANVFDEVDTLFCSSWGFLQPFYDTSTSYYIVYLVDTNKFAASTPAHGSEGSYINISYETANNIYNNTGISGYSRAYRGVVAHEYMHAIFYRYGIKYDTADRKWMHESFASWAGMAFESDYAAYRTTSIRSFLSSTFKSLNYFTNSGEYESRHYGSCLFPLYIQQEMGGYQTIQRILSSYSASYDPLTAIDTGLNYYNYSLAEAYSGCACYNFDTGYFYPIAPAAQWGKGHVIDCETYPDAPSATQAVFGLACHYTNYKAPANTTATLTITVDYSDISSGSNAVLKTIRTTASDDYYITGRVITNNRCTIVQYNFGNSLAKKFAIVPINTGRSGTTSYKRTAKLS